MVTGLFLVGGGAAAPPSERAHVILSSKVITAELASTNKPEDIALILYQASDVDQIWDSNYYFLYL